MIIMELSRNGAGVTSPGELFGIEIEVENAHAPPNIDRTAWGTISDGSLRNGGLEFISRPCSYDRVKAEIDTFYKWFVAENFTTSIRTSTHVHYNVLGYALEELGAALTAYSIVEPLLFRVCGQEREENIYCVPWYRGPDQTAWVRPISEGNTRSVRSLSSTCKYSALYLEPVRRFGTVEFRHAPAFNSAADLMFWIDLIRTLMTAGRSYGTAEQVLGQYYERGTDAFIRDLFGEELTELLRDACYDDFESIIDDCDSISVAEACAPLLDTYKVREWIRRKTEVEGDGQDGYAYTVGGMTLPNDIDMWDGPSRLGEIASRFVSYDDADEEEFLDEEQY